MQISWHKKAWDDYTYWQQQDKKTIKSINKLLDSIMREGSDKGLGKPKKLTGDLIGFWSRRIDEKNRLVYYVDENDTVIIARCRGHYSGK
jgi:toxin YoeB